MGLHMEPRKSQVVISVIRNTGTDPPREAIGPPRFSFIYICHVNVFFVWVFLFLFLCCVCY